MIRTAASSPLFVDLYELTMSAGYWEHGMEGEATFSLFLRKQPQRGYYVSAGLASALEILEHFQFRDADIDYLKQLELFKSSFLNALQELRFTGEVWALPEGSLFFPDEPVLEITAPIIQGQLVETFLINTIGMHCLVATKAARCVHAAQGRRLIDFSLRRTQGGDAGMAVARSTYIAGFEATSNVLAGKQYGIPVAGTMAHSFVQSFKNEKEAFEAYAATFPDRTILLIDTYDTINGARVAVEIARQMAASGKKLVGVRLDSGDMIEQSRQVRRLFDAAGFPNVRIFASGSYDEFGVAHAVERGAAIDAFGVGTKIGVSADKPYLDMAYKLVRYENRDVRKLSPGKKTLAGQKQIFRIRDGDGLYQKDIIGHRSEDMPEGEKLLEPVMKGGRASQKLPGLEEIRQRFKSQFALLPERYKQLHNPPAFPVAVSSELTARQERLNDPKD